MSLSILSVRQHLVALAALLAFFGLPAAANGALFTVSACGSGENHSWTEARTAPADQLETHSRCDREAFDPYGAEPAGLAVVDRVGAEDAQPDGASAEWQFAAPAGTTIRSAAIERDIGNRDEWTPFARVDGVDQLGESCVRSAGEAFCRILGTRQFDHLSATSLSYGLSCTQGPFCVHGGTLRTAWTILVAAAVTLSDDVLPAVTVPVAQPSFHRTWVTIVWTATDNTGIRRRRLLEGSTERARLTAPGAAAGGCGELNVGVAYTYTRPCADGRGLNGEVAMSVDPCPWGDGVHPIRAAAMDTGGNETVSSSAVDVRVDCTAPKVTLDGGAATRTAGETLAPQAAATDATSGVASTQLELSVDGGAWAAAGGPVEVEQDRAYRFRARATDVAGNVSAWVVGPSVTGIAHTTATIDPPAPSTPEVPGPPPAAPQRAPELAAPIDALRVTPAQRPAPAPRPRLTIARARLTGRLLSVSGRSSRRDARGTIEIRVRIRASGRSRTVRRLVALRRGAFSLRTRIDVAKRARIVRTTAHPVGSLAFGAPK